MTAPPGQIRLLARSSEHEPRQLTGQTPETARPL